MKERKSNFIFILSDHQSIKKNKKQTIKLALTEDITTHHSKK